MNKCPFYSHKAITAPCTRVIQPAKAPTGAEADSTGNALYQDKEGNFYAQAWICEAVRGHDRLYLDRFFCPNDFSWKCASSPKLAWVKLQRVSEKDYRIVGICDKPASVERIKINGDIRGYLSKSEPFDAECGAWRRPLSYACLVLVDVPVSVAVDAVVVPCALIVYAVSWTPLAAPFRWMGHQMIHT